MRRASPRSSCTGACTGTRREFGARALARAHAGPDGVRRLDALDEAREPAALPRPRRPRRAAPSDRRRRLVGRSRRSATAAAAGARSPMRTPALVRALGASAAVLDGLVGVPAGRLVATAPAPWAVRRAIGSRQPADGGRAAADHRRDRARRRPARARAASAARSCAGACSPSPASCRRARPAGRSRSLASSMFYDSLGAVCWRSMRPRARLRLPLGRDSDR